MRLVRFSNSYPNRVNRVLTNELMDFASYGARTFRGMEPSTHIKEESDHFVIELATPGLKREDLKIELDNDKLTISYKNENKERTNAFGKDSFSKSYTLGEKIDTSKIVANYENGVLAINLAKKEEAKRKEKVSINIQ